MRRGRRVRPVRAGVLQVELVGAAVLAPALGAAVFVEHESGVGSSGVDQLVFQGAGVAHPSLVLGVIAGASAAAVDPVVALDQLRERVPGGWHPGGGRCGPGAPLRALASGRARPWWYPSLQVPGAVPAHACRRACPCAILCRANPGPTYRDARDRRWRSADRARPRVGAARHRHRKSEAGSRSRVPAAAPLPTHPQPAAERRRPMVRTAVSTVPGRAGQ